MSLYELILSRRSIRQFRQDPLSRETLQKLVNAARLAPSGANRQPLEFVMNPQLTLLSLPTQLLEPKGTNGMLEPL